eukprot:2377691-Prymnesium_polylepis.2
MGRLCAEAWEWAVSVCVDRAGNEGACYVGAAFGRVGGPAGGQRAGTGHGTVFCVVRVKESKSLFFPTQCRKPRGIWDNCVTALF